MILQFSMNTIQMLTIPTEKCVFNLHRFCRDSYRNTFLSVWFGSLFSSEVMILLFLYSFFFFHYLVGILRAANIFAVLRFSHKFLCKDSCLYPLYSHQQLEQILFWKTYASAWHCENWRQECAEATGGDINITQQKYWPIWSFQRITQYAVWKKRTFPRLSFPLVCMKTQKQYFWNSSQWKYVLKSSIVSDLKWHLFTCG